MVHLKNELDHWVKYYLSSLDRVKLTSTSTIGFLDFFTSENISGHRSIISYTGTMNSPKG